MAVQGEGQVNHYEFNPANSIVCEGTKIEGWSGLKLKNFAVSF